MNFTAVDVGFRGVKGLNNKGLVYHQPSVVGTVPAGTFSLGRADVPMSIQLETKPTLWYVGEAALRQSDYTSPRRDATWVFSDTYRVLYYHALATLCDGLGARVNLVTGLPLQDYNALAGRALTEQFLGEHRFRYGDSAVRITVEDAVVVTQPFGSLADMAFTDTGEYADNAFAYGTAGVADIGGNTFGLLLTQEMEEIYKWSSGDGLGLLQAMALIARDIRTKYSDFDPRPHEIALWAARGEFPYKGKQIDIKPFTRPHLIPLVDLIVNRILDVWQQPGRIEAVLLTGGGSAMLWALLEPELSKIFPNIMLADEPIFANVRGYLKLAMYHYWRPL